MKIEKYKMFLSAARNAAPEHQPVFYKRAYVCAEESYGKNSPEVYAVLGALSAYLQNQGNCGDTVACHEQAQRLVRGA